MLHNDSPLSSFDQDEIKSAWKLGGTNQRSKKQFGNSFPLFGSIPMKDVFFSGQSLPYSTNTCIELEVAIKIPKIETDDLEFALCFELPQKRIFTDQFDLEEVLLDRCGANAIVVQECFQICDTDELQQSIFKMIKDSFEIEANTMKNLTSPPSKLLIDFLAAASVQGASPLPGEIVAIGGLGQCFPVSSGESYIAENEILGHLEMTVL